MKKFFGILTIKNALVALYLGIIILSLILSGGRPDWIILAMIALVGMIFWYSIKLFGEVEKIGLDLVQAAETVKDLQDKTEEKINISENLFKKMVVSEAYEKYTKESERLRSIPNNTYKCNISDYINTDLVDIAFKKNLLNLVPGTMTGLGILGTFIGLSISLRNFNTGTSQEITESIAPLMDGIKIAFHTSIYGMILSLMYNFFMKTLLEDVYTRMDEFLYVYERYIDNDSENDNNSTMQMLVQQLPEQLALRMAVVMEPIFVKISQSLDLFNEKARQEQEKGIEKMVSIFDEKMGQSLEHLSTIIVETGKLQKENSENMLVLLPKVTEMADNVTKINKLSSDTVDKMSAYITDIDDLQTRITMDFEKVCEHLEEETLAFENVKEYTDALISHTRMLTEKTDEVLKKANEQIEALFISNEIQVEAINKSAQIIMEEVTDKTSEFVSNTNERIKTLSEINEKQFTIINDSAVLAIGEISEKANEFVESVYDFTQTITPQLEAIKDVAAALVEQATDTVDKIEEKTNSILTGMSNTAKKQIESIHGMTADIADSMNEATAELAGVSRELSSSLKDSLDKIFAEFDTHLSDIANSLSGTIKEIEETTERVPETIRIAYDGMDSSLVELNTLFRSLVEDIRLLENQLSERINNEMIIEID